MISASGVWGFVACLAAVDFGLAGVAALDTDLATAGLRRTVRMTEVC